MRPDAPTLSLVAFIKNEGGGGWSRCRESVPIPRGIMLPSFEIPNRGWISRWWLMPASASAMTTMPCWWKPPSGLSRSPRGARFPSPLKLTFLCVYPPVEIINNDRVYVKACALEILNTYCNFNVNCNNSPVNLCNMKLYCYGKCECRP